MIETPEIIDPLAALDRIKKTLANGRYVKGWRGPNHGQWSGQGARRVQITERAHIALQASDVSAVTGMIVAKGGVVTDLVKIQHDSNSWIAARKPPEQQEVVMYADDVFHIVEQASK